MEARRPLPLLELDVTAALLEEFELKEETRVGLDNRPARSHKFESFLEGFSLLPHDICYDNGCGPAAETRKRRVAWRRAALTGLYCTDDGVPGYPRCAVDKNFPPLIETRVYEIEARTEKAQNVLCFRVLDWQRLICKPSRV